MSLPGIRNESTSAPILKGHHTSTEEAAKNIRTQGYPAMAAARKDEMILPVTQEGLLLARALSC